MEFGRVAEDEVSAVDFSLPVDGQQTIKTLSNREAIAEPDYFVGCAKWGRKEWKDLIYPKKTKEADFLGEYVKHFNSIELNAVFYNIPKEDQILKWRAMVEENTTGEFLFCPKFSRSITHIKRLKDADFITDEYIKAISAFGPHLGPCFLQVSDNFGPANLSILENYLTKLPKDLKVFVEVRHKDWFVGDGRNQLFNMLAKLGKGAAITDATGRRDCLHMELPTPEAFIRFVGNGGKLLDSDKTRIDEWIVRLKQWLDQGLEKVYFFLHQHDETDTPLIADYTIREFNKYFGSDLPPIKFINPEGTLF